MPPDSSAIDTALIVLLQNDAELRALMPDGVYFDYAPPNKQRFVIVSIVIADDRGVFGMRGFESVLYLVRAVLLSTSGGDIQAAAARIDTLLEDQPLTVAGYGCMTMHREERVRYTEVDDVDNALRWQHRGGRYRVEMAVA